MLLNAVSHGYCHPPGDGMGRSSHYGPRHLSGWTGGDDRHKDILQDMEKGPWMLRMGVARFDVHEARRRLPPQRNEREMAKEGCKGHGA